MDTHSRIMMSVKRLLRLMNVSAHQVKHGHLPLTSYLIGEQGYKFTTVIVHNNSPDLSGVESVDTFDTPQALQINRARLEHLESLGLAIEGKSVLDVGCGVGHLAQFFVQKGCNVLSIDGRFENIASLRVRYPDLKSAVVDVEKDRLSDYGTFNIVFCYGLLYHLENPASALQNVASVCKELFLIETCITDHPQPILQLVEETGTYSQALAGIGSRPSPSYIIMTLLYSGFDYVYVPKTVPDHADFKFSWRGDLSHWRNGHPLRQIFIASRFQLANRNLVMVGQCI